MPTITRKIKLSGMSRTTLGVLAAAPVANAAATPTAPTLNTRLDFDLAADAPERFSGSATISFIATPADGDLGALALDSDWTITVTLAPAPATAATAAPTK